MTNLRHAPKGPREANAAKRQHFIDLWCERNLPDEMSKGGVWADVVRGLASEAGRQGRLSAEYVSTRLARWK